MFLSSYINKVYLKGIPHNVGMFLKIVSLIACKRGIPHNVGMFLRVYSSVVNTGSIPHNVGMFLTTA